MTQATSYSTLDALCVVSAMWTICHSVIDNSGQEQPIEELSQDEVLALHDQMDAACNSDEALIPDNVILRDAYQCTDLKDLMRDIFSTAFEDNQILSNQILSAAKEALVKMAINDSLPSDMNEIDMEAVINGDTD